MFSRVASLPLYISHDFPKANKVTLRDMDKTEPSQVFNLIFN